jgi:hypothetical protein
MSHIDLAIGPTDATESAGRMGDLRDLVLLLVWVTITVRFAVLGGTRSRRQGAVACHLGVCS